MHVKLEKLTTSDSQMIFHVNVKKDSNSSKNITMISGMKPDSTSSTAKSQLYDENKNPYGFMYVSTDPFYKSYIYKKSKLLQTKQSDDFQDNISHKRANIIASASTNGFIYMLEDKTRAGHYDIDYDIMKCISSDNGIAVPKVNQLCVVTYKKDEIIKQLNDYGTIEDESSIIKNPFALDHNMIYEINGSIQSPYDCQCILANAFKCKNSYDCEYNMLHSNSNDLSCVRRYVDIQSCNDLVYLKYYDDCHYSSTAAENTQNQSKYGINIPKIEVIKQINRIDATQHNTNLYSVYVTTDIFDNISEEISELPEEKQSAIIKNLKNEMKNCIRIILDNVVQTDACLYKVVINNE